MTSWKEIADFLGVSARTAQTWEKERHLPVERVGSGVRPRIIADTTSLTEWAEGNQALETQLPAPGRLESISKSSWLALALLLLVGALGIAIWTVWFSNAAEPEAAKLVDSTLSVYSQSGQLLWLKSFQNPTALATAPQWANEPLFRLLDIDGDGHTEVLLSLVPAETGRAGKLLCYNRDGSLRWEFPFEFDRHFSGRRFQHFLGHALDVVEIHGRRLVLVSANHVFWFPSMVGLLDPANGKLVDAYWHPGHIVRWLLEDFDGDGERELLLGAANNPGKGLGHAALAVLKLPFGDPKSGLTNVFGDPAGREAAYLLFPRPDIADALDSIPIVQSVIAVNDDTIEVEVVGHQGPPRLFYYLTPDLQFQELVSGGETLSKHLELEKMARLDHRLSEAERKTWERVLLCETAPNANSPEIESQFRSAVVR